MDLQKIAEETKVVPVVPSKDVELTFYSTRRKANITLKTEGQTPASVKLTETGYEYHFDKPFFVSEISVASDSSEGKAPKITLEVFPVTNSRFSRIDGIELDDDSCVASANVNAIIRGFKIAGTKKKLFEFADKVNGVKVSGWSTEDLEQLEAAASRYGELRNELTDEVNQNTKQVAAEKTALVNAKAAHEKAIQADRTALDTERATHTAKLEGIKTEIKTQEQKATTAEKNLNTVEQKLVATEEDLAEQEEQKSKNETTLKEQNDKLNSLSNLVTERDAELTLKTEKSAKLTEELKSLSNDKSLFTDDSIGFTRQGSEQIKTYLWWVITPALVIGAVLACYSVHSAHELFDTLMSRTDLQQSAGWLFLAKVPFVAVAWAVYLFLFRITKPIITTVIQIYSRRMRLSEITILVGKSADSITEGLSLTDKEKAGLRMESRMQLIREHLSGRYEPNAKPIQTSVVETTDVLSRDVGLSKEMNAILQKAKKPAAESI